MKVKFNSKDDLVSHLLGIVTHGQRAVAPAAEPMVGPLAESAPTPVAKPQLESAVGGYGSNTAALDSFRILAGLVQVEHGPRLPSRLGETRTYEQLAKAADVTIDE